MSELKIGDLVFYKNYFCMITAITPINSSTDNRYDKLSLIRKFRCDGSSIKKSSWVGWEYRSYTSHPDELFIKTINRNDELFKIYKSIV